MNNQATLHQMKALKLYGMQTAFQTSMETRHNTQLTADELLAYLLEAERFAAAIQLPTEPQD